MLEWIITSSVLILILIGLRAVLRRHISPRLQYLLWALVLIRLLVPFSLPSQTSVANFIPQETSQVLNEPVINNVPVTVPDLEIPQQTPPVIVEPEQNLQDDPVQEQLTQITQDMKESVAWSDVLGSIWVLGMILMAGVLLCSNLRFLRKLRRTRTAVETDCTSLPVYQCSLVKSPCLFGLFRPSVYLTSEVLESQTLTRYVLAHELAHFRTKDHIWSLLRSLCLVIHWYNPLVWVAAVLSKRDAESWCDESAIHSLGEETRQGYGQALIRMSCIKKDASALLTTATTMSSGKKALKDRINLIAKHPKTAVYTLVLVIALSLVAVGCTFTGQQETEPTESTEITEPMDDGLIISLNGFSYVLDPDWVIGNPMPEHFTGEGLVWDKEDSAEPDGLPHGTKLFYSDEDTAYIFYLLPSESDPVRLIRQDILQLQENPPTEPDELQPTGYPEDEIQVTLAYVNGQLYIHDSTATALMEDVPEEYHNIGIIRSEDNDAVPSQEKHSCHLEVGTDLYANDQDDRYIYYWRYPRDTYPYPRRMVRYDLSGYGTLPTDPIDPINLMDSQLRLRGFLFVADPYQELLTYLPDNFSPCDTVSKTVNKTPTEDLHATILPEGTKIFCSGYALTRIYCQVQTEDGVRFLCMLQSSFEELHRRWAENMLERKPAIRPWNDDSILVEPAVYESFTYTDTLGNPYSMSFLLPELYPFTQDALDANLEIINTYMPTLTNAQQAYLSRTSSDVKSVNYNRYLNGDILSLVIYEETYYDVVHYCTYNFDLSTGKRLDQQALLEKLGISQDAFLTAATSAAKTMYTQAWGYKEPGTYAFYDQQLAATISEDNLLNAQIYISATGNVTIIVNMYALAGAGYYATQIVLPF